jgi:hypothetical protein
MRMRGAVRILLAGATVAALLARGPSFGLAGDREFLLDVVHASRTLGEPYRLRRLSRSDLSSSVTIPLRAMTRTVYLALPPHLIPLASPVRMALQTADGRVLATAAQGRSVFDPRNYIRLRAGRGALRPGGYLLVLTQETVRRGEAPESEEFVFDLADSARGLPGDR